MGQPETITMKAFRGMDTFSGEMRVVPGSRARRGVRRQKHLASCNSREGLAGSDAGSGLTAGGSARSSAARAADHKTDADLAEPKVKKGRGTPDEKPKNEIKAKEKGRGGTEKGDGGGDGPIPSLWDEKAQLDGGVPLPEDGVGFVDAVNVNIDLIRLAELLLRGTDERSSKSLLEKLLEMRYGKNARVAVGSGMAAFDGAPQVVREQGEKW